MEISALVSSIALPVAAAGVGAIATTSGTQSRWYRRLDKPDFQPPAAVFPVAWTALYTATAAGSVLAQRDMEPAERRAYQARLGLNMALNAGWCWSFFRGQQLGGSVAVAAALAVSTADLALAAGRADARAGALVAPYSAWTGFATVLTGAIWRRNA